MANALNGRLTLADFVGNHKDHRLVHDTPSNARYSDQRAASGDTASKSTNHTDGRGSEQSGTEEAMNEDDEDDSSAGQEDDQDQVEDDPEVSAPSHVSGKGKGKSLRGPAIRIEPAGDDEPQSEDAESASAEAGHNASIKGSLNGNKKRTFSNVSNTSLLFSDNEAPTKTFPRPKMARTLSHSGGSGLLTYKATKGKNVNGFDNAIESSDEEASGDEAHGIDIDDEDYSGVNLISDDEDNVEKIEAQESTFIMQDENLHTDDLFSQEFANTRRYSVDSHESDVFQLAPTGSYFTSIEDLGFGQFFNTRPAAAPSTPEPIIKRKFSDNSMKRVRFEDEVLPSPSSSSSSSELDSATFPDLFLDQDKLPTSMYQLMEADPDTDNASYISSASEHSYWDFGQDDTRNLANPGSELQEGFDSDSSDAGSSGYESMIDLVSSLRHMLMHRNSRHG